MSSGLYYFFIVMLGITVHGVNSRSLQGKDDNMTKVYLDQDAKIYNGLNAAVGQFPYQAFMIIPVDATTQSICGGTLISKRWVLTAAHCVFQRSLPTVYLGLTDVTQRASATTIMASKTVVYPTYTSSKFNDDVAMVQLSSDAPLSTTIQIAELPPTSMSNPNSIDNQMVFISGFGQTGPSGTYLEDHSKTWPLKYNQVKMFTYSDCQARTNLPNVVCVDRRVVNSGVCPGDSGGPLSVKMSSGKGRVYGITSFMVGQCQDPNPAGFAYVGSYLSWIQTNSGVAPPPS